MNKLQVLMIAPGEYPFNEELSNSKSALTKAVNIGIKHSYRPAYMDIDDCNRKYNYVNHDYIYIQMDIYRVPS